MKYYRFLPVLVLALCTTFLTHSAFSQTEITTLSSSSVSESETNGSFVITSIIDAASSDDVFIPLSFSGDAEFNQDYTVDFDTEGDRTTIYNSGNSNYGKMKILPDGNYLFLEGSLLRIYNPEDESLITKNLNNYYEGNIGIGVVSNTSFYAKINQGSIYKVDFSDLDAITETSHVGLSNNSWVESPFTLSGEILYYSVYNNSSSQRIQFKKAGDADPEIIGRVDDNMRIVDVNNKIYFIGRGWFKEYTGEVLTSDDRISFEDSNSLEINLDKLEVYNNEIYTLNQRNNNQTGKLSISDNQVSFSLLPVLVEYPAFSINHLDINPNNGNLILQLTDFTSSIELYTVNSYQLLPQLKIAAGETSGIITINGLDDDLYELTESIIVQPGIPTNAVYNTSLTIDGIAAPVTLALTSDDSLPEATYAFSSPTINEFPYEEVTLIATLSVVSGVDVTIPFTLSDNASTAVEVLSTEIVVLAGQLTGSITVSTTEDLDDDLVEILEPIVFTFGTISNATSDVTDITLNLESNDNPTITAIGTTGDVTSQVENGGSFEVTASINLPSSKDISIPFTLGGEAIFDQDYSIDFQTKGEQTTLLDLGTQSFGKMNLLPDGRLLYITNFDGWKLRLYDPTTQLWTVKDFNPQEYIETNPVQVFSNTEAYSITGSKLIKIDFSNLEDITITTIFDGGNDSSVRDGFSIQGDTILFGVDNWNANSHRLFRKVGDNAAEIIGDHTGGDFSGKILEIDDQIYLLRGGDVLKLIDGDFQNNQISNNFSVDISKTILYNNDVYLIKDQKVGSFNIFTGVFTELQILESREPGFFNFNSGNLLMATSEYVDNNYIYSVSSYQLLPELNIAAGETSGSITINGLDDDLYELTESIIVQPGAPTNASISDNLLTDGVANPVTLELTDDEPLSEVTFAFSSPTINEFPYEDVTLIATLSAVSGVDVTIPFTLSDNASTAVEVLSTEIVVLAGQLTGSITVSTTEDLDDDLVEILEPIVFTFGTISNATSDVTDITLNLESNDNPTITAIGTTGDVTSQVENGGSFEVTASINLPSSKDISIPFTLGGEAIFDQDYSIDFQTKGEQTTLLDLGTQSFGKMNLLPDGRLLYITNFDGWKLRLYDPTTQLWTVKDFNPQEYIETNPVQVFSNTEAYSITGSKLIKIDFSNLEDITITTIFDGGNDSSVRDGFSIQGDTILFGVDNWNANSHRLFRKVGDNAAEIIGDHTGGDFSGKILEIDDQIYLLRGGDVLKLIDGDFQNNQISNNFSVDISKTILYNNDVYLIKDQKVGSFNIFTGVFTELQILESREPGFFNFNSGNLLMATSEYVDNNYIYSVSSYQLLPELNIAAGETSGSITINGLDDDLYELTESIIVQPGTPTNASISDNLLTDGVANPVTLELTDDDSLSEVTFAFSSPTINEFPYEDVTLIATLSAVSGVDVTIPFTLSDNASTAVEVLSTEIVVLAGELTGSITVSTTEDLDDDLVEILEPIVFTFGTISNATSDLTDITLNLESDDNPTITAIGTTGDITSQVENGGSFEVTASIDLPSSKDVSIPLIFAGEAIFDQDYSIDFQTKGEETTIFEMGDSSYGRMKVLPDGRLVFVSNSILRIYNPLNYSLITKQLNNNYESNIGIGVASNTILYAKRNPGDIMKIDISDVDNIIESEWVSTPDGTWVDQPFTLNGETLVYSVYDSNSNTRTHYKKVGNNSPEALLNLGNDCCFTPVMVNNKFYNVWEQGLSEMGLSNSPWDNAIYFNNFRINSESIVFYNNEMYALNADDNNQPGKLIISDNEVSFEPVLITEESTIQYFDFNTNTGNLIIQNYQFISGSNSYSVSSYQLLPELNIAAGQTSGSITINGIDDDLYELTESIIVQPGTPSNASMSDVLLTDGVANPVTLELTDDDSLSDVTFAFSSPTINEFPYEDVTLIATLSAVSGVDVTIPFTLSDNASTAVEVLSTEIVVLAGELTGSITVSTTEDLDDDLVEILEPIVFTFGTISNATSDVTDITLNLESDDNPTITAIGTTGDVTSQVEDGSFEVTASISLPTSKEVTIPFTLSGDAIFNEDYTVSFDSEGEKSLLYNSDQSYGRMKILPDGKYIFLNQNTLRIYNPEDNSIVARQLDNYYEDNIGIGVISNTTFYAKINPGSIYRVDFSDLEAITETPHINLQQNIWVNSPFTLSGETLYYSVYDGNSNQRTQFKKVGDADPEIIGRVDDDPMIVDVNNKIYLLGNDWFIEYTGEIATSNDRIWFNTNNLRINRYILEVYNNEIYTLNEQNNNQPGKLSILDNQVSFSPLPVSETASINYLDVDSTSGNLILQVYDYINSNNSYSVNSYQLAPQLKIAAGETTGTFTLTGKDDNLFELTESLIVLPSAANNATYSDDLLTNGIPNPLALELTDNDELSEVVFELSSPTIDENSSTTVTLTASTVSGAEVIIPFTLSDDELSAVLDEEYIILDDVRQIVIPANGNSGSITISTAGLFDDAVEILEPIIFTFGDVVNATTETQDATLYIVSDDDPSFTGITVSKNEFAEHESSTVTANIDVPASRDVNVDLTFTGTATNNLDYIANFDNEGKKSLIKNIGNESYGTTQLLPDGRFVFLRERSLRIYDPEDDTTIEKELTNYYWYDRGLVALNNNILYAGNGENIYEIDISNPDAISETSYISFQNNTDFQHHISLSGNIFIYQVYDGNDSSNNRKVFRKIGDADPEIIYQGDRCCFAHIMVGDKIYAIGDYQMFELIDGEYVNERYYNNDRLNSQKTVVYNNEIYSISSELNTVVKLVLEDTISDGPDGNPEVNYNVTFEPLPISEDKQIQYFNFDSSGNLISYNYEYVNGNYSFELSKYQIIPQVTILAGETSGSLTLNGIEDELNSPGEETDETIVLNFQTPTRAVLTSDELIDNITLTLLNNEIDLVEDVDALVNVPPLSFSSVAWGDYDRDGDQDMAIMGRGIEDGVITRLYENVDGVFVNNNPDAFDSRYDGDLIWVDYNKDGYIDLIVSGLDNNDNPATTIYENQEGTFVPSTELFLPNLFGTSMDSGDLDNDGDIDFVINGIEIVNGVNTWRKYIYLREENTLVKEEDFNNQFNSDNGVKNGSVIIADNQFDGDLDIIIVGETDSRNQINTLINKQCENDWDCNNYNGITNLNFSSTALFGNYIYYMGQIDNDDGDMKIYRRSLTSNSEEELYTIDALIKGSIAVADYNNDGKPDMLITGENEDAESITKLYDGVNANYNMADSSSFKENTEVNLVGLRNSTAKWVDYDVDGDLDLFISGTSDEGEFTKIYRTDLLNKTNTPSSVVTGLLFEDLGYGKVKLSWDAPNDDFSSNLGYVIRLATSEGGSEISNTESNLETGQRLITKSPVIYNNSYETLLDPGLYYWSVQSVDDGLKGSQFSEENSFTLTYQWKELNQGGIIDRSINAFGKPIVKLIDIDSDNDMDLIYGSKDNNNDIQIFKLGTKKFLFEENLNNTRSISDIKFYDFNGDDIQDVLINTWDKNSSQGSFKLYNTNSENDQIFYEDFYAPGLFQSKVELIDINNDGIKEVVHIGRTNSESNSQLKVHVYEQENGSLNPNFTDISTQFGLLKSGSFAFGNADGDSDIDFAITGLTNQGIISNLYENQTLSTDVIDPIFTETVSEFPSAEDSTLDFFDYDGDGDLDIAITGQGISGPMFKILSNNGLTGPDLQFEEVSNTGLIPIREANLDFGDYNSDGYTDILYSGKVSGQGQITKLVEFNPNSQTYVESDFDLSDIINASIAFGDIDGDNDLDFAIAGESVSNPGQSIIKTYLNQRDQSAAVIENLGGRVDEEEFIVNQRPSKPTELTTEVLGYNGDSNTYKVKFSWDSGDDESTPKEGLTSALKIVDSDSGKDVMTINSLDNGYRTSAGKGNVEHQTEWIINLPDLPDNKSYNWTVQTIDAAFSGSELAPVQELDVDIIKLGDSNGDFEVTVLDLVTDVDYILGNVPSPFVFEAADVNNDEAINVLDITATVDIILDPDSTRSRGASSGSVDYYPSSAIGSAFFTWEGNDLYVESEYNIGGIQLSFDTDFEYQLSGDLTSIESLDFVTDNSRSLMLYSFNNTIIANSKTKLLTRIDNSKGINEDKIIVGTINGERLNGFLKSSDMENQEFELFSLYPNPSDGLINLEYYLPNEMDVVNMHIYDMQGRLVWSQELGKSSGIISNQLNLNRLSLGNYILSMHAYENGTLKHVANKRLILK